MKDFKKEVYLVSACLLGLHTRYDGGARERAEVIEFCKSHVCLPICPEQLAGLPTPRSPVHFLKGDGFEVIEGKAKIVEVEDSTKDHTMKFLKMLEDVEKLFEIFEIKGALLKDRSPSCGSDRVYIEGTLQKGCGIFCAFLKLKGVEVIGYD